MASLDSAYSSAFLKWQNIIGFICNALSINKCNDFDSLYENTNYSYRNNEDEIYMKYNIINN